MLKKSRKRQTLQCRFRFNELLVLHVWVQIQFLLS